MKKHISKLLIIMMLAVLFVPLFSNYALAWSNVTTTESGISFNELTVNQPYVNEYLDKGQYQVFMYNNNIEYPYKYTVITYNEPFTLDKLTNKVSFPNDGIGKSWEKHETLDYWSHSTIGNNEVPLGLSDKPYDALIRSNFDFRYNDGSIITFKEEIQPDFEAGFDEDGYGIRFLLPRNGFKDNSFLFSYTVEFKVPYTSGEFIPGAMKINFDGDGIPGTLKEDMFTYDLVDEVIHGFVKVTIGHEIGVNTIRAFLGTQEEPVYEAWRQTERLSGFIDEDGDGVDDRTGREDNNEEEPWYYDDYNPDDNYPNRDNYSSDIIGTVSYYFDTLLYWLLSPFRLIAEGLQSTLTIVTDTFGWAGNFANMIGGLFSFLPPEITGMITLAFTSLIVFTIIKVVRK